MAAFYLQPARQRHLVRISGSTPTESKRTLAAGVGSHGTTQVGGDLALVGERAHAALAHSGGQSPRRRIRHRLGYASPGLAALAMATIPL